jgi:autotransporter-associated beta strand protein
MSSFATNNNSSPFISPNLITGTLTVASATEMNTKGFTNSINFAGGTLKATGSFTLSNPVYLNDTFNFTYDDSSTFTTTANGTIDTNGNDIEFSGSVSGIGSLTKSGAGTLTLSGINTYSGTTTVNQGTLNITTSTFNVENNTTYSFGANENGTNGKLVTTTTTINPASHLLVKAQGATWSTPVTFTVINTTGVVNGCFGNVSVDDATLEANVSCLTNEVRVVIGKKAVGSSSSSNSSLGDVSSSSSSVVISSSSVSSSSSSSVSSLSSSSSSVSSEIQQELRAYSLSNPSIEGDLVGNRFLVTFDLSHGWDLIKRQYFCNDVYLKIEDTNNSVVAIQKDCSVILQANVSFEINTGGKTYLENAKTSLCTQSSNECIPISLFSAPLSIYGTEFDINKDAFAFNNGGWNKAEYRDGVVANDIARYANLIKSYLPDKIIRKDRTVMAKEEFWRSVGYHDDNSSTFFWNDTSFKSTGLCYGMVASSIAQFVHRDRVSSNPAWGINSGVENFKNAIDARWDSSSGYAKSPYQPFETSSGKTLYDAYNANDIEALKKIMYYFVGQRYFYSTSNNWVGKDSMTNSTNSEEYQNILQLDFPQSREYIINNMIKKNRPVLFTFTLSNDSSHTIVATQVIRSGKQDTWILYDNNYPGQYLKYIVPNRDNYNITSGQNNTIKFSDGKIAYTLKAGLTIISEIFAGSEADDEVNDEAIYTPKDPQNIYGFYNEPSSRSFIPRQSRLSSRDVTPPSEEISYAYAQHLKLFLVGGTFVDIVDADTNSTINLVDMQETLNPNQAYKFYGNYFNTFVYLPIGKKYTVSIDKAINFPVFEVYAKIPDETGKIKIVNYENLENVGGGATQATFVVDGRATTISATINTDTLTNPTFINTFSLAIMPPTNFSGTYIPEEGKVRLAWQNPTHTQFESVKIIRKEGSAPTSVTDGITIYNSNGTQFDDASLEANNYYFYAIFAFTSAGQVSTSSIVDVQVSALPNFNQISGTVPIEQGWNLIAIPFSADESFDVSTLLGSTATIAWKFKFITNSDDAYAWEKWEKGASMTLKNGEGLFIGIPSTLLPMPSYGLNFQGTRTENIAKFESKTYLQNKWYLLGFGYEVKMSDILTLYPNAVVWIMENGAYEKLTNTDTIKIGQGFWFKNNM